jgi:DNA replication and repair protein RecF
VIATPDDAKRVALTRLRLTHFRNHPALELVPEGKNVALTGPNGAGKTNLLEALSLLTPGRGLRRAPYADLAQTDGDGSWAAAAELDGASGPAAIGTGVEPSENETGGRRCRINGATVSGPGAFADHLRIVWLTPSMDGLFAGPAGDRRRFLDRLVLAVDPEHGARVSAFERALRSRNKLLEDGASDARWLDAVEHETAELAVSVAAARIDSVARLAGLIAETRQDDAVFPYAEIALGGWMEDKIAGGSAADAEDEYRTQLRALRHRDRAAGRATEGPHASDLTVRHGPKQMAAAMCSTGEQKALLLGLVLAHARLVARLSGATPLVLLDEVAAHLDPDRRAALYRVLDDLGAQTWLTGADPAAFAELGSQAALFAVSPGRAERLI